MTLTPSRSRTILHVRSGALQSHQSLGAGAGPVPARPVQGGGPSPRRKPQLPPCQEAGGGHHRAQGNEVTWPRRPRVTPLSSTSGGCHTGHERRRLLKGHFRGFNTMSRCIFGLYCTLEVWLKMLLSCIMGIVGCVVFLVSDKYSEYSAPDVSILVKSLSCESPSSFFFFSSSFTSTCCISSSSSCSTSSSSSPSSYSSSSSSTASLSFACTSSLSLLFGPLLLLLLLLLLLYTLYIWQVVRLK